MVTTKVKKKDKSVAFAKNASNRVAQPSDAFGLAFIEEAHGRSSVIVLTKNVEEAHRLVKLLAESRPEFPIFNGKGSLIELYRVETVGEMVTVWDREKHL